MTGFVFYIDGSATPNPGRTGWGSHGYRYSISNENSKPVKSHYPSGYIATKEGYIQDKEENKNKAVAIEKFYELLGSHTNFGTNNAAELQGLHEIFDFINNYKDSVVTSLHIVTDSEYLRRGIEDWLEGWVKRDWRKNDGTEIMNIRMWQLVYKLKKELEEKLQYFKISWTRSHVGEIGNEMADKLATIGSNFASDKGSHRDVISFDPKEYWKFEVERHPFINFKRLYFNSSESANIYNRYFIAEPGEKEELFGKKTPGTSLAVVQLNKGDKVIEDIKKYQFDISKDVNSIVMMRLDKVFQPDTYRLIDNYGREAMVPKVRERMNIDFIDEKPITVEIFPPGLIFRAVEAFTFLEDLLDNYLGKKDILGSSVITKDVTELFFDKLIKKDKVISSLKKEITQGTKSLSLDISVNFGDDDLNLKVLLFLVQIFFLVIILGKLNHYILRLHWCFGEPLKIYSNTHLLLRLMMVLVYGQTTSLTYCF